MEEPTPITPVMIATQREVDALFSETKHFTPTTTFSATLSTGVTVAYSMHTTGPTLDGHADREANEEEQEDVRVLFLAGLMHAMAPLIDLLQDKWAAARQPSRLVLAAFDSRGFGGSSSSWGFFSTHTLAMDALALMDCLGWPSAHIIGPSWGGMVAQELALAAPQRVRSLSLMHTSRGRLSLKGATDFILGMLTAQDEQVALQRALAFFYPDEALLTRPIPGSTETVGDVLRRFHAAKLRESRTQPHGAFVRQLLAIKTHFVSDARLATLGRAGFTITVIGGAEDKMVPGHESITLWNALGVSGAAARLVYLADVGHLSMVQCPMAVAQAIFETITSPVLRA